MSFTTATVCGAFTIRHIAQSPHADSALPGKSPPLVREHRLYQADWLLRFYDFDVNEIIVRPDLNLDLDIDPKCAWALANRDYFPIDVNKASREQLLRIPGIGARSVKRILSIRRHKKIRIDDLKKLRVAWKRAKAFVITEDHNPALATLDRERLAAAYSASRKTIDDVRYLRCSLERRAINTVGVVPTTVVALRANQDRIRVSETEADENLWLNGSFHSLGHGWHVGCSYLKC